MTVRLEGQVIVLEGDCRIEEAEALLRALQEAPGAALDMAGVRHLHAAVLQILLSLRVPVASLPEEPLLRDHVGPTLERALGVAAG